MSTVTGSDLGLWSLGVDERDPLIYVLIIDLNPIGRSLWQKHDFLSFFFNFFFFFYETQSNIDFKKENMKLE